MERTFHWRGWSKSVAMGKVQWGVLKRSYSVRKTKKRVAATDGEACAILGLSTGAELPQRERAEGLLGPCPTALLSLPFGQRVRTMNSFTSQGGIKL